MSESWGQAILDASQPDGALAASLAASPTGAHGEASQWRSAKRARGCAAAASAPAWRRDTLTVDHPPAAAVQRGAPAAALAPAPAAREALNLADLHAAAVPAAAAGAAPPATAPAMFCGGGVSPSQHIMLLRRDAQPGRRQFA